jgi:hypothetical protein
VQTICLNSSVFWVITRLKVVWNWRFGTTYVTSSMAKPWTLKMGLTGSSETSVSNYLMQRNNLEDGRTSTEAYDLECIYLFLLFIFTVGFMPDKVAMGQVSFRVTWLPLCFILLILYTHQWRCINSAVGSGVKQRSKNDPQQKNSSYSVKEFCLMKLWCLLLGKNWSCIRNMD